MAMHQYVKNLFLMASVGLVLTGCQAEAAVKEEVNTIPVETMQAELVQRPYELEYLGTVAPENQVNYSFKSAGRLGERLVNAGDEVKAGDVLARLDKSDLELQLSALSSQVQQANQSVSKASESWKYNKDLLDKIKKLYDTGSVSKDKLDQAKLQYEVSDSNLNQAKEAQRAATATYEITKRLVEDTALIAKNDGTVLATNFEPGELVPAGNPIVILRSETKVVQVGLSQDDIDLVSMDTPVKLHTKNGDVQGEIIELNDLPDSMTRTYLAKIRTDDEYIRLGKILDVYFTVGDKKGIWVPMLSIMSDGEQFVYVVEEGRAFKHTVVIDDLQEFEARISGVNAGDVIVTSGMKNLTDGSAVSVNVEE